MAQVLDAMATRDKRVSELATEIPRYEICKTKIGLDRENVPALMDALRNEAQVL